MGVSTIQLTESSLKKAKSDLESLNKQLRADIKNLDSTEKSLQGMWTGDAAKAFDATYKKDGASFEQFVQLVDKYVNALDQIMTLYEKGEKKNVETAKKRSYK